MIDARHLDDSELMAAAAGSAPADTSAAHLSGCALCRGEVEALRAALSVGRDAPSPFVTARAERDLLRAIDGELVARRRAWRPAAVAAAMLISGLAGAAGALSVDALKRSEKAAPSVDVVRGGASMRAPPRVAESVATLSMPPPNPAPAPALLAPQLRPLPRLDAPPRALRGTAVEDATQDKEHAHVEIATSLVAALASGVDVEQELIALVDRDPSVLAAIDDALLDVGSAFALRTRCERGLLTRRDRSTVEACRTFAQRFPADPAVRTLAFAAGRVAEDELDDAALAEEEYQRALVLSPFLGVGTADALEARARVRVRQGKLDEARADLLLLLSQSPSARSDDEVLELARSLGVLP